MIPHICRLITAAVKNADHAFEVLGYLAPFFDLDMLERAGEFLHARWLQLRAEQGLDKPVQDDQGAPSQDGEPAGAPAVDVVVDPPSEPTTETVSTVDPVPESTDTESVSTTEEPTVEVTTEVTEPVASTVDVVTDEPTVEATDETVTEETAADPVVEETKPARKWSPKKAA